MTTIVSAVDGRLGPGRLATLDHQHVLVMYAGAIAVPLHRTRAVITVTAAGAKHA
jgi:xanthine/uracil permease